VNASSGERSNPLVMFCRAVKQVVDKALDIGPRLSGLRMSTKHHLKVGMDEYVNKDPSLD
jgi:hypothetical protein